MNAATLKEALDRASVNPGRYDLAGGIPPRSEGLILAHIGELWHVQHIERGATYTLGSYSSEAEACAQLLEVASDPFYRT